MMGFWNSKVLSSKILNQSNGLYFNLSPQDKFLEIKWIMAEWEDGLNRGWNIHNKLIVLKNDFLMLLEEEMFLHAHLNVRMENNGKNINARKEALKNIGRN